MQTKTYEVLKDFTFNGSIVRKGAEVAMTDRQARSRRIAGFIQVKTKPKAIKGKEKK